MISLKNKKGDMGEALKWALWILVFAAGSFAAYRLIKAIAGGVI